MPELIVDLNLSADKMAAYYRGQARFVVTRASNGQTVQFPASVMKRHVTMDGVRGRFRLVFDDQQKFLRLEAVEKNIPN